MPGWIEKIRIEDRAMLGIASMAVATALFAFVQLFIKLLSARNYPTMQMVFFRSFFALIPILLLIHIQGKWGVLKTTRLRGHFYRGLAGIASIWLYFKSYGLLAMADAVAINFSAPLFMTLLSIPFLGEKVGPYRWSALLIGFVGVLIIVQPGGELFQPVSLIGLGGALCYAVAMITIRKISPYEHSLAIIFYFSCFCALISGLTLPFDATMPESFHDMALFVGLGILGGVGQFFLTWAFHQAPVTLVAPFEYLAIVWAILLGLLVFHEVPSIEALFGAAIVVASGLYITRREMVRRRQEMAGKD